MTLGIYIQVPFCRTKCTYCNFATGVFSRTLDEPYVRAVGEEIARRARMAPQGQVDTIYIGGGTPSLLDPAALARLLETLRANYRCETREITLEADPETVTAEKAAAWRAMGVNRISLGAQSFHDAELRAAGRLHRREDIFEAARRLREAEFSNLSFDLIAGLPHQSVQSWEGSLTCLLRLHPQHVSLYLMEIDEGSRLGREALSGGSRYGADALPSEDEMAGYYERACELLSGEGYEHYEISNWARQAFRSHHNLKYWRREPYLGLGAGAHSFDGERRWANLRDPGAYIAALAEGRLPTEEEETLSAQQALEEELFLGLRQLEGINLERIERAYGVSLRGRIERLREAGLVEIAENNVRLSPARLTVSNEVFVELMS